ncbi:MAG: hypothetical protein GY870_11285, partial [archaeon]|nr:hypothetical protein [archaeon]
MDNKESSEEFYEIELFCKNCRHTYKKELKKGSWFTPMQVTETDSGSYIRREACIRQNIKVKVK